MTAIESVPFENARVRIKRDVLFTETDDGVLFHNAHGGFRLTGRSAYRFSQLVVPYLNGRYQVRELCDLLPATHRMMVSSLVRMLLERGLARDVPAGDGDAAASLPPALGERFGEQIAYIEHYENDAVARFQRFRDATVAVLGDDSVAGWCALGLIRNGARRVAVTGSGAVFDQARAEGAELTSADCPAEVGRIRPDDRRWTWDELAGYDLVVCTGRHVPAQLAALLRPHTDGVAAIPEGARLLPVTSYGGRAVAGPLMRAGTTGCWYCAMLRLGFNVDAGAAADVWRAAAVGTGHDEGPGRELSALLGNMLGYEVFREFTQLMPAETDGAVVIQRYDSFDTTESPVLPHPQCPCCARPRRARTIDFGRLRPRPPVDSRPSTDDDKDEAIADLDALSAATVNPHCGVFTEFDDDWPTQLPLRVSRLTLGVGTGRRRTITAFDLHHVAGARMRAIQAAAAVYLDLVTSPETGAGDDRPMIEAARIATFGGIGAASGPWVSAQSLHDSSQVALPLAAVRPYGPANSAGAFERSGAGLGVGSSIADAAYRALLSAVGHRALRSAIGAAAEVSVIDRAIAADAELTFLSRCAADIGTDVELLSLDVGEHVAVLLGRAHSESGDPLWSIGADTSPVRAAKIALRDVIGARQILAQRDTELDLGHRMLDSFDPYTIRPTGSAPLGEPGDGGVAELLASLGGQGQQAFALLDDSPDLRQAGLRAVRVVLAAAEPA